ETFVEKQLLWQELRKFPPARALADTPVLRREYWWYVPRHIVRLGELGEPAPAGRRTGEEHGVLAWSGGEGLAAETVRVGDWEAGRIPVTPLSPDGAALPDGTPAALLSHDFEVPEMEQRATFLATGRLLNGRLEVEERSGERKVGKRPGLVARWRGLKSFERACKAGLAGRG
nr:pyridoxamine 5'-phosphate oxidase family protein [Acidobacteriota bacterium]